MRYSKTGVLLVAVWLAGAISRFGGSDAEAFYETTSCPQPNIAGFPSFDFPAAAVCGYLSRPCKSPRTRMNASDLG